MVENQISFEKTTVDLKNKKFIIDETLEDRETFYINITISEDFTTIENPHLVRLNSLDNIISLIETEFTNPYYKKYEDILNDFIKNIKK